MPMYFMVAQKKKRNIFEEISFWMPKLTELLK